MAFTICWQTVRIDGLFQFERAAQIFRGSAVVAQLTVNQLVAGSNPAPGATLFTNTTFCGIFCFNMSHEKRIDINGVPESGMLDFMFLLGRLKDIPRTGWTRYPIPRPESVADHSYRVSAMAMFFAPRFGADPTKTTQMLLLHDLGESLIGDVVTDSGAVDLPNLGQKLNDEREALTRILGTINAEEYLDLYDEFTANQTPEAQLANQLDKLEMAVQAREYEMAHNVDLSEFYVSAERRITHPAISQLLAETIEFGRE